MGNLLAAFKGLVTAPGYLVRDEASCTVADNVSFRYPGRIRPRGGFGRFANATLGRPMKLMNSPALGSRLLANTASTAAPGEADQLEMGNGSGAFATVPTIDGSSVDNIREERAALALCRRDHYVTSTNGVRRLDATLGFLRFAGMPRGLGPDVYDMDPTVYSVLSPGTMLPDGWARAYRVTWHRYEVDKTLLSGPPTGRVVIRNNTTTSGYTAGPSNVTLRIPVPAEYGTLVTALDTNYFWRLWATRTWDAGGGEYGDDECFLIEEGYLTPTDISNGYAVITEATPDAYLQGAQPLHTNAQIYPVGDEGIRQGVVNADDPPPVATDVAYHSDVLWFSKCRLRTRQNITLRAVGGAGFIAGDTFDVVGPTGTVTFTGVVGAPATPTEFTVVTGAGTVEWNIEATTRNLVACIQRNSADWGGSAYHVSLNTSEPGLFFLEVHRGSDLSLSASTSASPSAVYFDEVDNRVRPNRLFFSKPSRGDAVPPVNFIDVGSEMTEVLRISPFRDRLLVWTTMGLYQVTGTTFADFAVSAFDLTTKLVARESVAALDDRLYGLCSSGVVEVSEGGATVVSLPIDNFFQPKMADTVELLRFRLLAFGLGDDVNHEYRLYMDTQTGGPGCETWLTFDTQTRAWSSGFFNYTTAGRYDARNCGVVMNDGRVVLGAEDPAGVLTAGRYFYSWPTYADVSYDGTAITIATRLRFTFQAPNAQGLLHWQQTLVKYETLPLAPATVTFYPDENYPTGSTVVIANTVSRLEERVEVPWGSRRSTRMAVEYQPTMPVPGATTAPIDLAGIEVSYSSPTRYGRKSP